MSETGGRRVKIGIVGCGAIARRAHIPSYMRLPEARVEAVADIDEKAAASCAKKFGIPKWFRDYRVMLDETDIDAASICTPGESHARITMDLAGRGIHTLVEKPMATSMKDALTMVETADKNETKLSVAHVYRYLPTLRRIKSMMDKGELGRTVHLDIKHHGSIPLGWTRSTWLYGDKGAMLWDIVPHFIDILLWLGGDYEEIHAVGGDFLGTMGIVNHLGALAKFKDGGVGTLESSWVAGCFVQTLEVLGTGGYIFSNLRDDVMKFSYAYQFPWSDVGYELGRLLKIGKGVLGGEYFRGLISLHQDLIRDFITSIQRDTPPPIPGAGAIRSVRAIENVLKLL